MPHATLTDTGLVGITGKVPMTEENRALLTPRMLDGISMIFAPGGYSCIVHVMDFPWDADGAPETGIGSADAALIADWPGLQFDNSRDYIQWGFAGALRNLPPGVLDMTGIQLHTLVGELTTAWHPQLRRLFAITEPTTCFPLNIRTSAPILQWPASNITLLGDAIHTMTPGGGVGANTALRDAKLLCRNLTAARDGVTGLHNAVHDYETEMINYGFDAVKKSLAQMSGDNPHAQTTHRPRRPHRHAHHNAHRQQPPTRQKSHGQGATPVPWPRP